MKLSPTRDSGQDRQSSQQRSRKRAGHLWQTPARSDCIGAMKTEKAQ
jgi:hypothetical protein